MISLLRYLGLVTFLLFTAIQPASGRISQQALGLQPDNTRAEGIPDPRSLTLDYLGTMGGELINVVADEFRAYLAYNNGLLAILDVSDPVHPVRLSITKPSMTIGQMMVIGTRLYALGSRGLLILDVHDPVAPTSLGMYIEARGALGGSIEIVGSRLYVVTSFSPSSPAGDAPRLLIFDIANPAAIRLLGDYTSWGWAAGGGIQVVGPLAYIAGSSLMILDVSDPAAPIWLNRIDPGQDEFHYHDVHVQGNLLFTTIVGYVDYSVGSIGVSLVVFDISTPKNPRLLGRYTVDNQYPSGLAVQNHTAFLTTSTSLYIIDASQPSTPTLQGQLPIPHQAIRVVGSHAFLFNWETGLQIIDIHDPSAPILQSQYAPVVPDAYEVDKTIAYIPTSHGLQILDMLEPWSPVLKSTYHIPGYEQILGVTVSGGLAYISAQTSDASSYRLQIADVSDPSNPFSVGSLDSGTIPWRVTKVLDGRAFQVIGNRFRILDISEPAHPTVLGSYIYEVDLDHNAWLGLDVAGSTVYAVIETRSCGRCNPTYGFMTIDIHDPAHPQPLARLDLPNVNGASVGEVQNGIVYIRIGYDEIMTIDARDARQPTILGRFVVNAGVNGLDVAGHWAYIVGNGGISILDIANPAFPILHRTITDTRYPSSIRLSGDRLYVGDLSPALSVYRIVALEHAAFLPSVSR